MNSSLLKHVTKLTRLLEPKAELHRKQDMVTLASYVSEAETLVHQLPPQKVNYLQPDLAVAVKAIGRGI